MLFYRESDNMKKLREIVNNLDVVEANHKQSEKMFATIREICKDGYWDWDLTDNYKYLTPSLKAQLGYEDDEIENVHKATEDLAFEEDLPYLFDELDKHFSSKGEYPFKVTLRYKHKNGSVVKILCRGQVVEWNDNGEPLRMVGSHVDITNI